MFVRISQELSREFNCSLQQSEKFKPGKNEFMRLCTSNYMKLSLSILCVGTYKFIFSLQFPTITVCPKKQVRSRPLGYVEGLLNMLDNDDKEVRKWEHLS